MPDKSKICVEIPDYLKAWIDGHDLGQNALVTLGLRMIYLQEQNVNADKIVKEIKNYFEKNKLPF